MRIVRTRIATTSALALCAALAFAGCGGGGGGGSGSGGTTTAPATDTGDVTLSVTDAATDEIDVFEVDVVGFRFLRADGASVEVLSQAARVDFAQLVSVSEVIAGASLPVGDYVRAYMTLDFNGAMVRISGSTSAAALVDGNGAPLSGREELEIVFPNGGFTVGARKGYFAEVDFDLDQSLEVDAAANKVEVDSILYATIDPAQPKDARVPGLTGNFSGTSFDLDVRRGLGLVSRGKLRVDTTASTVFDLEGVVQSGQTGYDALEAKGDGKLILATGRVDPQTRVLSATKVVYLPQDLDEIGGLVVARAGGPGGDATLTLRGVAVRRGAASVTFNDTVTLLVSHAATKVNKRGVAAGTLNTDAINVGQRVLAYGRFSGTSLDLSAAGAGFVHLVETDIAGAAAAPPAGSLTVDVTRIGRRLASAFDLKVNGVAQGDLKALSCSTGGLSLASVTSGSPVVVRGFFAPVSSSTPTTPTFNADSVVDRTNAASQVRLSWIPAAVAPIQSGGGAGLAFDLGGAVVKSVDRGLVVPTVLTQAPRFVSPGTNGLYAIRQGFKLTLFTSFDAWAQDLQARVTAGARMHHVRGLGKWDTASNQLTAQRAVAILTP
ncbi:MAG: hypothetical protein AB7N76_29935 [Planctomycetota bacterium]